MMKKTLCFILLFILFLSSCGVTELPEADISSSALPEEEYIPDTSVFGVAFASNESTDPYTTPSKINFELCGLICEPLFAVSETFEVTPVLCSDYTYSDREYTFNIKSGVTFSDGSALSPSDVEYSLRAAAENGSYFASSLSVVESIRSSNSKGYVKVRLKYDNARFPALLDIPIVKSGTRKNIFPIGTGIYAPKDDKTALVTRDNHHSGKNPHYKVISLHDVASSDELVFEFDSHNISLLASDPTGTSQLIPSSLAERTNVPSTLFHYVGFNTRKPLFSDKNNRRAVARAIDRDSAASGDFALMGNATALPVPPASALYNHSAAEALSYQPDTPLPFNDALTILVNSENSGKVAVCKRIAETLTRLGAPTTVRALPFDEYTRALSSGDFDLYYAEVALGSDFDITRLVAGSLNFGGFYDASLSAGVAAYLGGDEGLSQFFTAFCDTVPFAPVLFKDTAVYTEKNFFEKINPSSQNIYHDFCNWKIRSSV